ncbi:MAG: hypothetical protein JXA60_01990 [Candidatus Coatesbacteria bacterium]|nr:hypothetical protein [Candidatus Coatesbacteria bacterium]
MKKHKHVYLEISVLILILSVFFLIGLLRIKNSDGFFTEDEIAHYMLTYSAKDRFGNLIEVYNKPLFALLYYPFVRAGIEYARLLTLIISTMTLFLVFSLSRRLQINSLISVLILATFPAFFSISIANLTEPLAALLLILTCYFTASEKYKISALFGGLLPLTRFEGAFLLACFIIYWLTRKELKAVLVSLYGLLLWWITSFIYTKDALWLYESFRIYGTKYRQESVDVSYWFKRLIHIFGPAGLFLLLIGFVKSLKEKPLYIFLFSIFMLINIILSYIGTYSRYDRFFVTISPVVCIIASIGFSNLSKKQLSPHLFYLASFLFILVDGYYEIQGRHLEQTYLYRYIPIFIILSSFMIFGFNWHFINKWIIIALSSVLLLQVFLKYFTSFEIPFPYIRLARFWLVLSASAFIVKTVLSRTKNKKLEIIFPIIFISALPVSLILPIMSFAKPRQFYQRMNIEEKMCENAVKWFIKNLSNEKKARCNNSLIWYFFAKHSKDMKIDYRESNKYEDLDYPVIWDSRYSSNIDKYPSGYKIIYQEENISPYFNNRKFEIIIFKKP